MKKLIAFLFCFGYYIASAQVIPVSSLPLYTPKCDSCLVLVSIPVNGGFSSRKMYSIDVARSINARAAATLDSTEIKRRIRDTTAASAIAFDANDFGGAGTTASPLRINTPVSGGSISFDTTAGFYYDTLNRRLVVSRNGVKLRFKPSDTTTAPNLAPVASAVTLLGSDTVGKTRTTTYIYADAENNAEGSTVKKYYTYTNTSGAGSSLVATASNYVIARADTGKFLRSSVTPYAAAGTSPGIEVFSSYSAIIRDSAVNISTSPGVAFISTPGAGSLRNDFAAGLGYKFTPFTDISIKSLGRWIVSGNTQTHTLYITNAAGTVLASTTLNAAGKPSGQYAYADLSTPLLAGANVAYYVFSSETVGGDQWYDAMSVTSNGGVVDLTAYHIPGNPVTEAGGGSGAGKAYVPPNFLYDNLVQDASIAYTSTGDQIESPAHTYSSGSGSVWYFTNNSLPASTNGIVYTDLPTAESMNTNIILDSVATGNSTKYSLYINGGDINWHYSINGVETTVTAFQTFPAPTVKFGIRRVSTNIIEFIYSTDGAVSWNVLATITDSSKLYLKFFVFSPSYKIVNPKIQIK